MHRMLADAVAKREQLALHVVGDSAVAIVVRLMGAVAPDSVWRALRVRFEHGGIIGARDLWTSAAAKGVVVVGNLQLTPSPEVVRMLPKAVVESMAADFSADNLSRFPIGLGSDGVSRSPFVGMFLILSFPAPQLPTREMLVRGYTLGSAYAEHAEREKGSIAPGMLADIAVLSQDIFTVQVAELPRTESVLTLVGGRVAWDAGVLR